MGRPRQNRRMSAELPLDNPFLVSLGLRMTAWSPGAVAFELAMSPRLGNRSGRVQGGVICTLLDAAAGYAGLYTPPGEPEAHSVTLSLTSHFMSSGEGSLLRARGNVERRGRSVYFARAEVWLDGEQLLASGIGAFKYLRSAG